MGIIARSTLVKFWRRYPDAEGLLRAWFHEVKAAQWKSSAWIKEMYATASIVSGRRVVFNIGGNKYRLVVHIHYHSHIVFVRFIGTHKQYDSIDPKEV